MADNRWISAEPPREEIRRKHDGASIWTIFAFGKRATDDRIHPQERKQVPRPATGAHQFRQISTFPRQGELPKAPSGHVFKAVRLRAPIVVVCRTNSVVVELMLIHAGVAEMPIDHHHPTRITQSKRP